MEIRLSTELVSVADLIRELRDAVVSKLEDHEMVIGHEHRIRALESKT